MFHEANSKALERTAVSWLWLAHMISSYQPPMVIALALFTGNIKADTFSKQAIWLKFSQHWCPLYEL